MLWYCATPLVLYVIRVMVYVSVVAYARYVIVLWHAICVMVCHWCYGIVPPHCCCFISVELWYMSVLWHMPFMLWYYATPLVLYIIGVMVYVSIVAYVIYVSISD